jgi:hypothetical protein
MLLSSLLLIPIIGIFVILINKDNGFSSTSIKYIALSTSIVNLILSFVIFILFDFSTNQFQFVHEHHEINYFDFYLGVDGLSIYFILLTTIIIPISLLSNWTSISFNVESYVIILLLLETLLLAVFLVLDILLFYIFFESILPPLFILIGIFGSDNRVRASFYLFLYTFNLKCKRAKHRGSPKALVTKVVKETLQLAWLMPQGMVKSLVFIFEKLLWVVDTWVITVLSHPYLKAEYKQVIKGVKEQRVDGSSISRNLDFVRCTLVAGKPVFGRKIHYRPDYIIFTYNKFIHITRSTLDPWFVTGFVDAEGCFTLGIIKNDNYITGYQIQAIFKISLHGKDYDLLCQIRDYFGVGKITKHGDTTMQYLVRSLKDLDIIISHFDTYPLISQKWADYKLFKQAITLIKNKEHLTKEGFKKVLSLKASINLGLSDELKLVFPYIIPVSRPSPLEKNIKGYNYIAGLASGDGCFYISIRNSSSCKLEKAVVLKFQIVQHSRDIELMEMLIFTLGCGRIELAIKQSAVYFVVLKFKDISEKLIPFFDKYPIKGVKALDYSDFKKVVLLMNRKTHLTEQGLSEIQSIKLNMNLFRKKLVINSKYKG